MVKKELVFSKQKMETFIEKDIMLRFVFKNLVSSKGYEESEALEIVFNGYVLNDSTMERVYQSL